MTKIKSKAAKYIQSEYLPAFVFGLMIFFLLMWVPLIKGANDDIIYFELISKIGVSQFLIQQYTTWSGRMSAELMLATINYNMPVWRALNACVSLLFIVSIFQYTNCLNEDLSKRRLVNWMVAAGFFMIQDAVITSSVLWCTGSYYYLWTSTALLWALLPFYRAMMGKPITHVISYVPIFIASAYASYMEQPLAILVCAGLFILVYLVVCKKRPGKMLYIQYIFILANVTFCFLSPGTKLRLQSETSWYPDFSMMSQFDLIFQAVNWTSMHLVNNSNILFFIVTLLNFALYKQKYRAKASVWILSAIPMFFMLTRILPWDTIMLHVQNYMDMGQSTVSLSKTSGSGLVQMLNKMLFMASDVGGRNTQTSYLDLLPSFACLAVILINGVLLLGAFEKKELRIISFLMYMAALASGYIMFLSPTIFASRSRIFFVTDTLLLFSAGMLFAEYVRISDILKSPKRLWIIGTVCLLAVIFYFQLFDLILVGKI